MLFSKKPNIQGRLSQSLCLGDFGGPKFPLVNTISVQAVPELKCEAVDDMSCVVVSGDYHDETFKSCSSCDNSSSSTSSCGLTELNSVMKPFISELHPIHTDFPLLGGSGRGFRGRGRRGGRRNTVRRRQVRRTQESQPSLKPRIPRSLGRTGPVPTSMDLTLNYSSNIIVTNPVAAFAVRDFRINSPFSPDPLVAGSVTGLPSLANLYSMMRVINFRFQYSVVSIEPTNALSFYWTFKDAQPSLGITTYNKAVEYNSFSPGTPLRSLGGATGNNRFQSRVQKLNPASVLGEPASYFSDRDFSSSLTANPAQILWGSFVLLDENATTFLTTGVILQLKFMYTVRLFSPSLNLVQLREDRLECEICRWNDSDFVPCPDHGQIILPSDNDPDPLISVSPTNPNDVIDTLVNALNNLKS